MLNPSHKKVIETPMLNPSHELSIHKIQKPLIASDTRRL